jgi:hypothetical protein
VIETSLINRTHLSRPEDGRRVIFRNVVDFIFLYFTFYILFTLKTMDKVQETSGSQCKQLLWRYMVCPEIQNRSQIIATQVTCTCCEGQSSSVCQGEHVYCIVWCHNSQSCPVTSCLLENGVIWSKIDTVILSLQWFACRGSKS